MDSNKTKSEEEVLPSLKKGQIAFYEGHPGECCSCRPDSSLCGPEPVRRQLSLPLRVRAGCYRKIGEIHDLAGRGVKIDAIHHLRGIRIGEIHDVKLYQGCFHGLCNDVHLYQGCFHDVH